jgi:hypothetical protein
MTNRLFPFMWLPRFGARTDQKITIMGSIKRSSAIMLSGA